MQGAENGYTLLAVEDDRGLLRLMEKHLRDLPICLVEATTGSQALAFIDDQPVDLLLLDYKLPDMDARELVETLGAKGQEIPFIVITGQGDERLAVEMMKHGARDYLMKEGDYLELLPSVVGQALEQIGHRRRLAAAEEAVRRSEARYRGIFAASVDAVFVVDDRGRVAEANRQAQRMFGYSAEDFSGLEFRGLFHGEPWALDEQGVQMLADEGYYETECVGLLRDGTQISMEARASRLEIGDEESVLVVVRDISQRKWALRELEHTNERLRVSERALRERQARLRAIFQGTTLGVALVDLAGRALESNYNLHRLFGVDRAVLHGQPFTMLVHPDEREDQVAIFRDLAEGRCEHYQVETRCHHPHHGVIWVRITASLVRNEDGRPNYVVLIVEDVTEHKQAELELRESHQRFELLAEATLEGIMMHQDGQILLVNRRFADMLGYEAEDLRGTSCLDLLAEEERERVAEVLRDRTGGTHETVAQRRDGTRVDLEIASHELPYHGRQIRVISARDITERKKNRAALAESEAKYRLLFENMTAALAYCEVVLDEEGSPTGYRLLEINPAFEQLFGMKREEVVGRCVSELLPAWVPLEFETWMDACWQVAMSGRAIRFERRFEGLDRWLHLSIYSPQALCFAVLIEDITERRLIEEELRDFTAQVERSNRELEHFACVVDRGLEEPLGQVRERCESLERSCGGSLGGADRERLVEIRGQVGRMQRILRDVRLYARIYMAGQPLGPVDLAEVGRELREELAAGLAENRAELDVGLLPVVQGDREQLKTVLEYLVSNSLRYRREETPRVGIAAERNGEWWVVAVSDNGVGIAREQQDRIFELFQVRRGGELGSGISLSVCKKIVERHGGRIWCESEPGVGSTFRFTVPVAEGVQG